jgi:hypothetical protein
MAAALSGNPMAPGEVDRVADLMAPLDPADPSDPLQAALNKRVRSGTPAPPTGVASDEYTPALPTALKKRVVQVYRVDATGQPIIFDAPLASARVNALGPVSKPEDRVGGALAMQRIAAAKRTAAEIAGANAARLAIAQSNEAAVARAAAAAGERARAAGASDAKRAIAEAAGAADARAALAAMPATPIDLVDPMLSDIDVANLTRPRGPAGRGGKRGEQMSDARLVSPALIAPIAGSDAAPYGFEGGLPGRLSDEYTAPRDMPAAPRIDPRTVPPPYIAPRLDRSPMLGTTTMHDVIDMSDRFGHRSARKMLEGTPYEELGADLDQHFGPMPAKSVPRETAPQPKPRPSSRSGPSMPKSIKSLVADPPGVARPKLGTKEQGPPQAPKAATTSYVRPSGPAGSMPPAPATSRTETIVTEFRKLNPAWSEPVKIDPLALERAEKAVTMGRYNPAHLKLLAARDAAKNAPVVPKYITERRVEEVVVRGGAPAPAARRAVVRPAAPPAVTFQGSSSGRTYVAGQKYTINGETKTAQADGSFKSDRTGKSTPGSSVKANVGGVRSGVSTGSDGVKRSYNTSTNQWEVVG